MTVDTSYGEQKQFVSINRLTQWVFGIFVALAILNIIAVVSGYTQAELLNRAISGGIITTSEATANDSRQALIGFAQFALYIASGIVFFIWIHRAHRNLPSLYATDLRFTPGWAVGWFFVPIMSLFRPYQVASEIWKASDPKVNITDGTAWKSAATSPIIGWWWAFFLISNFISYIVMRMSFSGEELPDLLASTYAYMVSDAIDVVGIIITILMVRRIGQFQETKSKLISSP
jgi:hypothetical protein